MSAVCGKDHTHSHRTMDVYLLVVQVDTADCNRLASMFSLLEELRTEDDLSGALFIARKRLWFSKM